MVWSSAETFRKLLEKVTDDLTKGAFDKLVDLAVKEAQYAYKDVVGLIERQMRHCKAAGKGRLNLFKVLSAICRRSKKQHGNKDKYGPRVSGRTEVIAGYLSDLPTPYWNEVAKVVAAWDKEMVVPEESLAHFKGFGSVTDTLPQKQHQEPVSDMNAIAVPDSFSNGNTVQLTRIPEQEPALPPPPSFPANGFSAEMPATGFSILHMQESRPDTAAEVPSNPPISAHLQLSAGALPPPPALSSAGKQRPSRPEVLETLSAPPAQGASGSQPTQGRTRKRKSRWDEESTVQGSGIGNSAPPAIHMPASAEPSKLRAMPGSTGAELRSVPEPQGLRAEALAVLAPLPEAITAPPWQPQTAMQPPNGHRLQAGSTSQHHGPGQEPEARSRDPQPPLPQDPDMAFQQPPQHQQQSFWQEGPSHSAPAFNVPPAQPVFAPLPSGQLPPPNHAPQQPGFGAPGPGNHAPYLAAQPGITHFQGGYGAAPPFQYVQQQPPPTHWNNSFGGLQHAPANQQASMAGPRPAPLLRPPPPRPPAAPHPNGPPPPPPDSKPGQTPQKAPSQGPSSAEPATLHPDKSTQALLSDIEQAALSETMGPAYPNNIATSILPPPAKQSRWEAKREELETGKL